MERLTWRERRLLRHLRVNVAERMTMESAQQEMNRIYNQRLQALALSIHQNAFVRDASSTTSRDATRRTSARCRRG